MSEEELAPQDLRFFLDRKLGPRGHSEGIAILARDEQRWFATAIVEEPPSRWIETIGARDAQHIGMWRDGPLRRVVEEREARVVVVGQKGSPNLRASGLRTMVHGGKVTARPRELAEMRQTTSVI